MIRKERIAKLNKRPDTRGRYVLYWMQQAQRAHCNHALEFAIDKANDLGLPLVVFFGITPNFPGANANHYRFMLEGLAETMGEIEARGAYMLIRRESPEKGCARLACKAAAVVCDLGYLGIQRSWRRSVARASPCALYQVETDVIVPVEDAMQRQAYSAAVLRPKIESLLDKYMVPLKARTLKAKRLTLDEEEFVISDVGAALDRLGVKKGPALVSPARGGREEALGRLKIFLRSRLLRYASDRNDPLIEGTSGLSPYLHFGQISALEIALAVKKTMAEKKKAEGAMAFLEEMIVRRELAMNFAHFNAHYDSYNGVPEWARKTLASHEKDRRPYVYSRRQLEGAATFDPYWNAAQREMMLTGRMHGYMRMYWGKKVIEWSPTPQEAFETLVYLNDRYELDGRDPNGYAGISWCFGTHDRPWGARDVFGTVRYMNAAGLRRKFDADGYVRRVESLSA